MASQGRPRRFLPADPRVEEPYRFTPQLALRVAILGFVALAVFAVLFLRLWALQVLSGTNYLKEAKNNRVRITMVEAPRGEILDAKGRVLVDNAPGTSLEVWPDYLPKNRKARLKELAALSLVAGMSVKQIETKIAPYVDNPLAPVVLRRGIHPNQVTYLNERQLEFPGVDTPGSSLRNYPDKSLLAQVLGYVGPITQSELPVAQKEHYQPQDVMGQAGIEKSYDRYLKGTDGTNEVTVDSLGRPTSEPQPVTQPIAGNNLRLTININLQRAAEKALSQEIHAVRANGSAPYADGGAIVAMDPHTGAILAMASNPTYQPSIFVSRDPSKLAPLENAKAAAAANSPSLNRAIDGVYPPGSTWKPVTALAAMQEQILTPDELLQCTPSITIFQQLFKNWDPYVNQPMNLTEALAESCDTYFYQVGEGFYKMNALRGPTLQNWASRFGFGQTTGIDVGPESPGLLPTPDWLKKAYPAPQYPAIDRIWKPGFSVQLAIGQGDLEVTPLQMTRFYAMIANGGDLVTPHIAEDVEAPATDTPSGTTPQILRVLATQQSTPTGVDPSYLSAVQEGLYAGTHSVLGTSYGIFGQFPIPIAGKTGSAQKDVTVPGYPNPLPLTQSWWCGYGPFDNPSIVVCAVIENGGEGASAAAPAALQVFESYFDKHNIQTTTQPSD